MPRFRKGTNDADGDGRKGGSLPADTGDTDMVKVKGAAKETKVVKDVKPAAKKPAAKPAEPKGPSPEEIEAADLEASVGRHPGGMEPPLSLEEDKARVAAQFAEADRKADPRFDEEQAIRAVRGF